ncbi:MAG: RES family NAD+ phosphorylase [Sphingobacteriales bacterium]|jgi:RES domain-containing protein|nr:RES family NAD+ phosphorylase [Sphingobacteriales bacterium]
MRVYRISKCRFIKDLSGYGAFLQGGRWNSLNQYMIYTSQSIALSMLEVLVHFQPQISPEDFCLLTLELPDNSIEVLPHKKLQEGWNRYAIIPATQTVGDSFLKENKKIALQVPSSIIEQESNFLLNPNHPDFEQKVKIISIQEIKIDKRLVE